MDNLTDTLAGYAEWRGHGQRRRADLQVLAVAQRLQQLSSWRQARVGPSETGGIDACG
jgi:hypothetical protein